jgi:flavin-dependent thymidylate synthase
MKIIENNEKWFCHLCSSASDDSDNQNVSFDQHLKHHNITHEQYNYFIKDLHGGTSQLKVKLLSWSNNIEETIIAFVSQTWGATFDLTDYSESEILGILELALNGKTLPLALEAIQFTFQIDNLSRAISHQLVRVRIGSSFSQKGMSDTYYGDTNYIIPASIEVVGKTKEYLNLMKKCSDFYKELFEAGVEFQDARYVIPHAATTSLSWSINFLALKNFCSQRMSCTQSWEMNALCKLIKQEVSKVLPKFAEVLRSRCEMTKKCSAFGNTFEGCGKYPMIDSGRDFVFSKEQVAKNLRFDDDYRKMIAEHNKNVEYKTNYFRELVKRNGEI